MDKKEAIARAAMICISKYGIEKTNSYAIAKEMGIAQSGVFYHFPSQTDLFDSLLTRISLKNHELVSQLQKKKKTASNLERLKIYITGNLAWAHRFPEQVGVLLNSFMKTSYSKAMTEKVLVTLGAGEESIYRYLACGVVEKEFRVRGEIRETAKLIHETLIGAIISFHYSRSKSSSRNYSARLVKSLALYLQAP